MYKVGRGVLQAWRREILRRVRERGGVPARWRPQGKRIPEGSFQRNGFVDLQAWEGKVLMGWGSGW